MRTVFAFLLVLIAAQSTARADVVDLAEIAQKKVEDGSPESSKKRLAELEAEMPHLRNASRAIGHLLDLLPTIGSDAGKKEFNSFCVSDEMLRARESAIGFFDDVFFEANQLGAKSRLYTIDRFKKATHPNTTKAALDGKPEYLDNIAALSEVCESLIKGDIVSFEAMRSRSQKLRDLLSDLDINIGHLTGRYFELFNRVGGDTSGKAKPASPEIIADSTPLSSVAYTLTLNETRADGDGFSTRNFAGKTAGSSCKLVLNKYVYMANMKDYPWAAPSVSVQASGQPQPTYGQLVFSPLSKDAQWSYLECGFGMKPDGSGPQISSVGELKKAFAENFGSKVSLNFSPLEKAKAYCDEPSLTWLSDTMNMPSLKKNRIDGSSPQKDSYPQFLIRKSIDAPGGTFITFKDGKQSEGVKAPDDDYWTGCNLHPRTYLKELHVKGGQVLKIDNAETIASVEKKSFWSKDLIYGRITIRFLEGPFISMECQVPVKDLFDADITAGEIRRQLGFDLLGVVSTEPKPECLAMKAGDELGGALASLAPAGSATSAQADGSGAKATSAFPESSTGKNMTKPPTKIGI